MYGQLLRFISVVDWTLSIHLLPHPMHINLLIPDGLAAVWSTVPGRRESSMAVKPEKYLN